MTTNRAFEIRSGYNHTLGANYDGEGVNFAIFSAHAERVELCLYDPSGEHEIARLELPEYTDEIWHGYVPKLQPGALYGYRVYGPTTPSPGCVNICTKSANPGTTPSTLHTHSCFNVSWWRDENQ